MTLDDLIRMGCTHEASVVFEAVKSLCEGMPSKRIEHMGRLSKTYQQCKAAYTDMLEDIDAYKQDSGGPIAKYEYKWHG